MMIVAIPIAVTAVLVADVAGDSQAGKVDARLSTGLETALSLNADAEAEAERAARRLLGDPSVVSALRQGDPARIEAATAAEGRKLDIEYLAITPPAGRELVPIGGAAPLAAATVKATATAGAFELVASTTAPRRYLDEVTRLTGLNGAVTGAEGAVLARNGARDVALPEAGSSEDVEVDGEDGRAGSVGLPGSEQARVTLFAPLQAGGFFDSRPRIGLLVAVLLAFALAGVFFMGRVLQRQIGAMLEAARRIRAGDFTHRVPVEGRDEMAGLASEFNSMTARLEEQVGQLRRQRDELNRSVRRLGQAFAAGLDRDALFEIVAETALVACEAEYVRVALEDGTMIESPEGLTGPARDAAAAAQKRSAGDEARVESKRGDGHALAAPIRSLGGESGGDVLAIGREQKPFDESEREVFLYLIGQASASIENISAHERVSEQAVTDDLTGLPNNRAFRETIDREASRAGRSGSQLSLIILDVDDFKQVNDTYGHLQGDEVLRLIGRLLNEEPRAIDEPGRYGGEEFVVALPQTGVDGAVGLAERMRERLAAEEIPSLGGGAPLSITASFGTATFPEAASSVRGLFTAADAALYEAKRTGKNRVVTAPAVGQSRR